MEKFKAEHIAGLLETEAMTGIRPFLDDAALAAIEARKYSFTAFSGDRVLGCGGIQEYWPGRGEAWAVLDPNCKREFLSLHHAVRNFIWSCPVRRIEASVVVDFEAGHRWIQALGFQLDAPYLKAFLPDGQDCALYSRVV